MHLSSPMLFSQTHRMIFFLKIHTFKVLSTNTILILPEKELFHRCKKIIFVLCTSVPQTTDQMEKKIQHQLAWLLLSCGSVLCLKAVTLWLHQPLPLRLSMHTGNWRIYKQRVLEYYEHFAGETQTPSVGPVGLASAMFPAMLIAATSNRLPAHQGGLSFPWYIKSEPQTEAFWTISIWQ